MRLRLFPHGGGAVLRRGGDRARRAGCRPRPARGLERLAGGRGRGEPWAHRSRGRHRSVRCHRAPATAARDARAVLPAPQSRWHHRDHHGRLRLDGRESSRREVAAHDPAAAPVVLHPGEHAPLVRRRRAFGGASGPSLEARSGVADRLPVAANARPARPRRDHRQPGRHACQPVRCHAHRPAQSRVRNSAAPQLLRGPWVPGECSERICASGTRPGTQCEKRGAHYWIAQQCRFIGDSPALPRVRLAAGQGRNFFRPAALLVAPAAKICHCPATRKGQKGQMVSRARVYVVIPAYNEGPVIARVVTEVKRAGHAVVVVDDGSSDTTADQAHAGGAVVIQHPFNLGQGAALQTGIDYALAQAADFIVTFDADGQHRLSDISRLVEALVQERADFALGSRFLGQAPNLPPLRRLLLRAATAFTRLTTGLQVTDTHNGLRAMTRRGAAAIRLRQNRMAHASEWLSQIAMSGLRYVERPVTIEYTAYSLAKGQSVADAVLILLDLFARRLYR